MANVATYRIIGVMPGGRVVEGRRTGAPQESWTLEWAKRKQAAMVIRYFPSRKGWRILDVRQAQSFAMGGSRMAVKWTGHVRGQRYYPTPESAIMVAIHKLAGHSSAA